MLKNVILFTAIIAVFTVVEIYAAPADQPQTGQKKCDDASGNELACAGTGQDGELQTGVAWPTTRFSLASSGSGTVVIDNLTGLMWPRNAGTPSTGSCTGGAMTWQNALNYVACLNTGSGYLGYTDWRLPNVNELESLLHAGFKQETCGGWPCTSNSRWLTEQGFINLKGISYWSSTSNASDTYYAWGVNMLSSCISDVLKIWDHYVWPVREEQ